MQSTGMQGSTPAGAAREGETMTEQASAGLSRLTDSAQHTIERLTQAASQVAGRLSERGEELLHAPAVEKTRAYMREHPLATIAIAVGVGLVISKLLSRR